MSGNGWMMLRLKNSMLRVTVTYVVQLLRPSIPARVVLSRLTSISFHAGPFESRHVTYPHAFFNHVNIFVGSFGFNYACNRMYRGCLWLAVVFYGSLWVHGAPLWPSAHPAHVLVASPSAKRTESQYVQYIFR